MYPVEKIVNATVAMMKAAGTAYPPPDTATGTLNIIAASGAAPVTMQNNTAGRPSASRASSWVRGAAGGAAAGVATDMRGSTSRPAAPREWTAVQFCGRRYGPSA